MWSRASPSRSVRHSATGKSIASSPDRFAMSVLMRDFHQPGRSPAFASEGMAATSHPLASVAALEILRAGGTAADAAIAAVATLCVVEPAMTGIGGDCFCLIADPGKPVWGYNGSGRAAGTVTAEALLDKGV